MSGTRCTISVLKKDKTIKTITVNYDGDVLQAGRILNNGYKDVASVNNLIAEGNISGLYAEENLSDKKSAQISASKKEYITKTQGFDYNYIFDENSAEWSIIKAGKFKSLNDEVEKAMKVHTKKKKM